MIRIALGLTFIFSMPLAHAEYRAYELQLIDDISGASTPIVSTFDHIQYPGYYHVPQGQRVVYMDSWMCPGNTSNFKPICPKPDLRQPAEAATP